MTPQHFLKPRPFVDPRIEPSDRYKLLGVVPITKKTDCIRGSSITGLDIAKTIGKVQGEHRISPADRIKIQSHMVNELFGMSSRSMFEKQMDERHQHFDCATVLLREAISPF